MIPSSTDIFNFVLENRTLNVEGNVILQLRNKRLSGLLIVSLAQSREYKGINSVHLWGNIDWVSHNFCKGFFILHLASLVCFQI